MQPGANRLSLTDIAGVMNIYDDDDITILLTFIATDKNGNPLSLPTGTPVNRTRGVAP